MTNDDDHFTKYILSSFTPFPSDVVSDWNNVVNRAGRLDTLPRRSSRRQYQRRDRHNASFHSFPRSNRRFLRRSVITAFAIVVALSGSAFALSASNNWWFFYDGSPIPTSDVFLVTSGAWDGHPWVFTAHRTEDFGICYSLTQGTNVAGRPGSLGCSPATFPTPGTSPLAERMMSSGFDGRGAGFPASFYGAASDSVTRVAIIQETGAPISISTIAAPESLNAHIRFFVAPLPIASVITEAIGYDSSGNPIARNLFSDYRAHLSHPS